jgi:type I restriction enzyme S subunit
LESKYIFYRLLFSKELLESKGTGTTFKQINKETVVTFLIPLPPLPEQRAIAHVLRTIQRAIEATERVFAAARELKKSLMRHLFTYGPVPPAEAESVPLKETEIGPLPVHWQVVRLGEVTEKTHQIDPRRRPDWRFKYVDVSAISSELLRIQYYSEYLGKDAPHRARKVVKANDVIFATIRPCLKRIAIVPDSLDGHIASTAFCVVRCKPDLADSHFIFSAVSTDGFVERVSANQRGSSYPAVTDKNVLQQYIPLPPLSEQQRSAEILQVVDAKIQAEENRKAALQSLFKSMLHRLMTGKVRLSWEFITRLKEDR